MPASRRSAVLSLCLCATASVWLSGCGDSSPAPAAKAPPSSPSPAMPVDAPLPPQAQAINAAVFDPQAAADASAQPTPAAATAPTPAASAASPPVELAGGSAALIKAEVLLARQHFSPGVIDGLKGDNLKRAISAFETAKGLPVDGKLSATLWTTLNADTTPAIATYTLTDADVAGPFIAKVPAKFEDQATLPAMSYTGPVEALAEKFHMGEKLLQALNPGVYFTKAGTRIVVANLGPTDLPAEVKRIEVDKARNQVRAYGADGALLAVYPATVGSTDRPSPVGSWKVKGVAKNPPYEYDPARLTFGKIGHKLEIKPGPNNPVGSVWIDLTKDTFGIHGTPDPQTVGKTASHGCVRLTNWDALQLAAAVRPGTVVDFIKGGKTKS